MLWGEQEVKTMGNHGRNINHLAILAFLTLHYLFILSAEFAARKMRKIDSGNTPINSSIPDSSPSPPSAISIKIKKLRIFTRCA